MNYWLLMERIGKIIIKVAIYGAIGIAVLLAAIIRGFLGVK